MTNVKRNMENFPAPRSPLPTPHSPFRLLALPEQTAYSRVERRARLGVVHRVLEDGLQVIDGVADGQPFAVGHGLGDDAAPATYVFAHRVGQPQLVRFAQRNLAQDLGHVGREQKAPEHRQVRFRLFARRLLDHVFHLITAAFLEFNDAVTRNLFPGNFLYAGDQRAGRLMSLDQSSGEGDFSLHNIVAIGVYESFALRNVRARDHQWRAVAVWAGLRLEQDFDAGQLIAEFVERLVLAARRRRWVFVLAVERVGVFACDDDDLFQPGCYELLDDQLNRGFIDDRQKFFRIAQSDRQHSGARTGGGDYACFDFHKLRLISMRFWLNLQSAYDLAVEKDRLEDRLENEV